MNRQYCRIHSLSYSDSLITCPRCVLNSTDKTPKYWGGDHVYGDAVQVEILNILVEIRDLLREGKE